MRALHPDRLREFADAAAGSVQLMLQVGAFELLARFAPRTQRV